MWNALLFCTKNIINWKIPPPKKKNKNIFTLNKQYGWSVHRSVDWLCLAVQSQFLDVWWFDIVEMKVRKSPVFATAQYHYYSSRLENVSATAARHCFTIGILYSRKTCLSLAHHPNFMLIDLPSYWPNQVNSLSAPRFRWEPPVWPAMQPHHTTSRSFKILYRQQIGGYKVNKTGSTFQKVLVKIFTSASTNNLCK